MANLLEREKQAKKEARKKMMEGKKERTEKLDITLEEILKEPDLDKRIRELEEEVKIAEERASSVSGKLESVVANSGQKDEKGQAKFDEYKKGLQGDAERAKQSKNELAKKLKFYKAFKEHGNEILNLRDYQVDLQKKLEFLEAKNKQAEQSQKDFAAIEKETASIEEELQKLLEKRREIDYRLKQSGLSDEERAKLQKEKAEVSDKMNKNNEKYQENVAKRKDMTEPDVEDSKKTADEIRKTQIAISETSTAWRCLLHGKNWDEIQTILTNGKFTGEKGTYAKIKALGASKDDKGIDLETQKLISKNVEAIMNGQGEGKGETEGSGTTGEKGEEGEKPEAPVKAERFEEKHPRLAKIPFLARIINNRNDKKFEQMKAEYDKALAEQEDKGSQSGEKSEDELARKAKDLAYIDRQMAKGRDADMLRSVAEKGIRETVKVDQETRLKLQRVAAARAQAEKFGGKYEEQAKAEEEKGGIEPGDE